MDKEDFKVSMKDIFEEAQEEFMNREVRIPHGMIAYECPNCLSKTDFHGKEYPIFVCDKCKCKARLDFVILSNPKKDEY